MWCADPIPSEFLLSTERIQSNEESPFREKLEGSRRPREQGFKETI